MPYIPELLKSSISVILRYHEDKLGPQPNTEQERIKQMLDKPHPTMITDLTALIEAAVTANARDGARRPLMLYILHNIDTIRSFVDHKGPLDEASLAIIKAQLIQFIVDLQTLLSTIQRSTIVVNYNQKSVELFGLKHAAWELYTREQLCTSGNILRDTLFTTLLLPIDTSRDNIERTISDMLLEYQRRLDIVAREDSLRTQEAELTSLRTEVPRLEALVKAYVKRDQEIDDDPVTAKDLTRYRGGQSSPSLLGAVWAGLFQTTPQHTANRVGLAVRRTTGQRYHDPSSEQLATAHPYDW